ncbi:MAG: serine/threonine protein kinase [Kineosporiaceae bacterium]|nr:serine/threonine protein kinase [Kineosporiaceae bacterium]
MDPDLTPLGPDDPHQIGEYRLRGVLGTGGMAKVYLGLSPGGRRFAVKVVHSIFASSPEFRDRFRREIEAAGRLSGVYSPGVASFDADAPSPWMATRFINGRSLQERVDTDGVLAPDEARQVVLGLAEALQGIHAAGYVHRDIKPSNVVFDQDGPHVIDFGIIAKAAEESGLTGSGQVIGTPRYMAPERIAGDRATPASDIYSLGALLHFLLTGQTPMIIGGKPDLSAIADPHLAGVVAECLDRDAANRPTARELLTGLDVGAHPMPTVPMPSVVAPPTPATQATPATPATAAPPIAPPPVAPTVVVAPTAVTMPAVPNPPVAPVVAPLSSPSTTTPPTSPPLSIPPNRPPVTSGQRRKVLAGALAAAVVLAGGGLGVQAWRNRDPGSVAAAASSCLQVPAGAELSAAGSASDGACFGFSDGVGLPVVATAGFGRDPAALRLQNEIFAANRAAVGTPYGPKDLTVVWLGSLSCPAYTPTGACQDGRDYDAERQALQALRLSQRRADLGGRLRVVIADAGADMRHTGDVVRLITAKRAQLGRVVAVGGGDSRDVTKQAFNDLLDAGIPFVAPNLTSDDDGPGLPFVNRPGYLQLSVPNQNQADAAIDFIAAHTPATASREVLVYHVPDAGDLYTTSFARDVQNSARSNPRTAAGPARIVSAPEAIPRSVCRSGTGASPSTAVVFVDRWNTFGPFADAVTRLCGAAGPDLVVGGDSVNRFMTNDAARAAVRAPWPLAYFKKGTQCAELVQRAGRNPNGEAARLLNAARRDLGACGTPAVQLGDHVSLVWDAVAVGAAAVEPSAAGSAVTAGTAGKVRDVAVSGAINDYAIRSGVVTWPDGAVMKPLCVLTVDRSGDGGRSQANCAKAFPSG